MPESLRPRVDVQLRLALLSDCGCSDTLAALEEAARSAGLTGAEIDAALEGRSFEARTSAMIAFACALKACDPGVVERARERAVWLGVSSQDLAAAAEVAAAALAGSE
jgi:hypothetical protein